MPLIIIWYHIIFIAVQLVIIVRHDNIVRLAATFLAKMSILTDALVKQLLSQASD